MRWAVAFTTYAWDGFVQRQFERLRANAHGLDLVVVTDDTRGSVPVPPGIARVETSAQHIEAMIGTVPSERYLGPPHLLWFNLDILFYRVFVERPDVDLCFAVDFDAWVNLDLAALLRRVEERKLDLMARFHPDMAGWSWAEHHRVLYGLSLCGCFLAVTALSRQAASHLLARRRELADARAAGSRAKWPFCEAFVPTELMRAGYRCGELAEFGPVGHYRWRPAHLEDQIMAEAPPGFVHPVRPRLGRQLVYEPG